MMELTRVEKIGDNIREYKAKKNKLDDKERLSGVGWFTMLDKQREFLKFLAVYGDIAPAADATGITVHEVSDWKNKKIPPYTNTFRAWLDKAMKDPAQFAKDLHVAYAPQAAFRISELVESKSDSVALSAARLNQEIAGVLQDDKNVNVIIKMFRTDVLKPENTEVIEGEYAKLE